MVTVIALSAYALLMLVVASLSFSSSKTMSSFLVADRSQNKLIITISMLASTIGGGITIGTVNRASSMGFAAFWFVAAGAFAHFLQGALSIPQGTSERSTYNG
jgi:Na+/proline symporter